jgi:hypothetical protein
MGRGETDKIKNFCILPPNLMYIINVLHNYYRKEQTMPKKTLSPKNHEIQGKAVGKPKRLSKMGEWMKAHPDGVIVIHDLRAVLK